MEFLPQQIFLPKKYLNPKQHPDIELENWAGRWEIEDRRAEPTTVGRPPSRREDEERWPQ